MEIRKYLAIARHWYWLILLGAVLAGLVAFLISRNQPAVYRTSARYLFESSSSSTSDDYREILIRRAEAQTLLFELQVEPLYNDIVNNLGLSSLEGTDLFDMVSISTPQDTFIVDVTVEGSNPDEIILIANELGQVYDSRKRISTLNKFDDSLSQLDASLLEYDAELEDIAIEIDELGSVDTIEKELIFNRLIRQQNELQENYNSVFASKQDILLETVRASNSLEAIQGATASTQIGPNTATNSILAALVGAMLAVGIVFLMEYLDDSVKTPDEIFDFTGLSTLATIAFIDGDVPADRLITAHTPRAPISEAYRVLRTNLSFAAIDSGLNSLLVTSSSPSEGKSTTSANLSVVMAQTGRQVIIVDADLRRPSQHKIFEVTNNQGLTTALLDSSTPVKYHLQETPVPGLRIMASGPLPPNPAELLNSHRMEEVLDQLLEEADFVLVDTPPVLTVADAAILAPNVSGCLLVAEMGSTRRDTLLEASSRLKSTNASLFGLVLNRSKPGKAGYYQYYYDRYYTYDYSTTQPEPQTGVGRLWGRLVRSSK